MKLNNQFVKLVVEKDDLGNQWLELKENNNKELYNLFVFTYKKDIDNKFLSLGLEKEINFYWEDSLIIHQNIESSKLEKAITYLSDLIKNSFNSKLKEIA